MFPINGLQKFFDVFFDASRVSLSSTISDAQFREVLPRVFLVVFNENTEENGPNPRNNNKSEFVRQRIRGCPSFCVLYITGYCVDQRQYIYEINKPFILWEKTATDSAPLLCEILTVTLNY